MFNIRSISARVSERRSRDVIVERILKCCASESLTVSRLMLTANLSHKMLKTYVSGLIAADLLKAEEVDGKKMISTTRRGTSFLRCYHNALSLMNGQGTTCCLVPAGAETV